MNDTELLERLERLKAKAQSLTDEINLIQEVIGSKSNVKPKRSFDIRTDPRFAKLMERRDLEHQTGAEGLQLQKQFKLKVAPHYTRILRWRATKDPSVFDGLKREWE